MMWADPFLYISAHRAYPVMLQLLGVTATCALELGVDIGELDVTLHLGFPGACVLQFR